jgi:hypothetical protein
VHLQADEHMLQLQLTHAPSVGPSPTPRRRRAPPADTTATRIGAATSQVGPLLVTLAQQ